jgi:hypothetical protein
MTRSRVPIDHRDVAMSVVDQCGLLKGAGDDRHRRTVHAEHDGEELMTQLELVAVDAVVRFEKPAAASLAQRVQPVARAGLNHRRQEGLRVAANQPVQRSTPLDLTPKRRQSHLRGDAVAHRVWLHAGAKLDLYSSPMPDVDGAWPPAPNPGKVLRRRSISYEGVAQQGPKVVPKKSGLTQTKGQEISAYGSTTGF